MFEIRYHPLVQKKDLKKINQADRKKVFSTIRKKLSNNPEVYGKALLGDFKGYYRLRIASYRVIYKIDGKRVIVYILQIGMRRNFEVYVSAAKRLGLL